MRCPATVEETITVIKDRIRMNWPLIAPANADLHLMLGGAEMPDAATLGHHNVTSGVTLELEVNLPLTTIGVNQRGKQVITLSLEASDTIDKVKAKIKTALDIPPEQQHLIFGKTNLDNDQTLSQYDLAHASVLNPTVKKVKGKGMG